MALGIALLGTGNIAQRAFVPAVQAVDGACLVAVLSRDRARGAIFAQQYGIPEIYDDLKALLQSPRVDAVIVASPDAMHDPKSSPPGRPASTSYAKKGSTNDAMRRAIPEETDCPGHLESLGEAGPPMQTDRD